MIGNDSPSAVPLDASFGSDGSSPIRVDKLFTGLATAHTSLDDSGSHAGNMEGGPAPGSIIASDDGAMSCNSSNEQSEED